MASSKRFEQVGSGDDEFLFTLQLEEARNLHLLLSNQTSPQQQQQQQQQSFNFQQGFANRGQIHNEDDDSGSESGGQTTASKTSKTSKASNLSKVSKNGPSQERKISEEGEGLGSQKYYLLVRFLGYEITTKYFKDLNKIQRFELKGYYRIKSSEKELEEFFEKNYVSVFLISENLTPCGASKIGLNELKCKGKSITPQKECWPLIQRVYTMKSSNNNNTFSKDDPNRPVVLLKFSVQKDLKQNENGFAHDSDLEMNQEPFVNKLSPNSKRKSNGKERKSLKSSYQWNGASIDSSKFDQPFIFGNNGEEDWRLLFRETDEYKAALEIEMWKHKEEEKFRTELEEREIELMQILSRDWKKQKTEWEEEMKTKKNELQELKQELVQAKTQFQERQQEFTLQQNIQAQNVKNEFEQELLMTKAQLEVEKSRREDLVAANDELKEELREMKKNMEELERKNSEQSQQLKEIEILKQKLEASNNSKQRYKAEWIETLKELTKLKKEQHSKESKDHSFGISIPVSSLTSQFHTTFPSTNFSSSSSVQSSSQDPKAQISQLMRKKNALLETGNYTKEDRLIKELNARINELILNS